MEVFKKLEEFMSFYYDILSYTNDLKKFIAGPIIKRFLNNLQASESINDRKKIYLYSANDYNVAVFVRAHNFTVSIIDYGCTVIFEKLRGNDNEIYVRVSIDIIVRINCNINTPTHTYISIYLSIYLYIYIYIYKYIYIYVVPFMVK
jgi:hypothetical protein